MHVLSAVPQVFEFFFQSSASFMNVATLALKVLLVDFITRAVFPDVSSQASNIGSVGRNIRDVQAGHFGDGPVKLDWDIHRHSLKQTAQGNHIQNDTAFVNLFLGAMLRLGRVCSRHF